MIDRRRFLGGVMGLALGTPMALEAGTAPSSPCLADDPAHRAYLTDIAGCNSKVLGVLRGRSLVEQGLHPVAPERVLVLDDAQLRRFAGRHRSLKERFRQEDAAWRERYGPGSAFDPPLPQQKLDLCVGLMNRLSAHYRRPDVFGEWARMLWRREQLGSTGIGYGLGLLHDFQSYGTKVRTDNGVVDWWLVLLPGGVDWQAVDAQPVYYMVGPVMEDRQPGDYLRVMEGMSRSLRHIVRADGFDPAAWAGQLAGLSVTDAARQVNQAVARGLCETRRG